VDLEAITRLGQNFTKLTIPAKLTNSGQTEIYRTPKIMMKVVNNKVGIVAMTIYTNTTNNRYYTRQINISTLELAR